MIKVIIPATETTRGIGRAATAAEVTTKTTGANGPAFLTPESFPSVPLNNSVTSTSATEAATANAVKTAYDRAVSAANAVSSAQSTANSAQSTANSAYSTANSAYSMASNAAPTPSSYGGKGQWRYVSGTATSFPIPSGGTWAYFAAAGAGGALYGTFAGVASGGSYINSGFAGSAGGFCWRIA